MVFLSHLAPFGKHPVWYAAISHLSMTERAKAQHHRHVLLLANLKESAQVALPAPIVYAFHFFHMIPKNVCGHNGHAAFFHFPHFISPFVLRNARIMHLAHHRHHSFAIKYKALVIPMHRLARYLGMHTCNM